MSEIASAYVAIIPSIRGVQSGISRQLSGVNVDQAGASIGSRLSSRIGTTFKRGALLVGAGVSGVLATALVKGFERLNAIDQAKAKLTGLGHNAASVSEIMNNALASVKGTAYGLGDAATAAASLSASGVKQGAELTGVLKTIADTAAISGRSLTDISTIYGSVAARGKLQGDDMLQLMSSGVPVLQFLAKHLGITSAAASELVSKGKIDFKTFSAAMHENLGGAALSSGKTFTGAMANMKAALGRVGANVLSGVFSKLAPALTGITKAMGPLEDKAAGVGKAIGDFVNRATPIVSGAFKSIGPTLAAMFRNIGTTAQKLRPTFDSVVSSLKRVGESMGVIAVKVGPAIVGMLSAIKTPIIVGFAGALRGVAAAAAVTFGFLARHITTVKVLGAVILSVVAGIKIYKTTVLVITAVTKAWAAVQAVMNAVLTANPIGLIVVGLVALGVALVLAYRKSETFRAIVQGAFRGVAAVATWLWANAIKPAFDFIKAHIGVVVTYVQVQVAIWSAAFRAVAAVATWLWHYSIAPTFNAIRAIIGGAIAFIRLQINVGVAILRGLGSAASKIGDAFRGAFNSVRSWIGQIVTMVTGLPGKILSVAKGMGDAGIRLMNALFNGIKNVAAGAGGIAASIVNKIIDALNSILPHKIGIHKGPINLDVPLFPNIPHLADGGIIPATPGGRVVRVAEAGQAEAVIPLPNGAKSLANGAGQKIENHYHIDGTGLDVDALAVAVERRQSFRGRV